MRLVGLVGVPWFVISFELFLVGLVVVFCKKSTF